MIRLVEAIQYEIKDKDLNAISIAIIKQDAFFFFKLKDLIYRQRKKIKADKNTIYRVGSVSKLFTDIAIMEKKRKWRY